MWFKSSSTQILNGKILLDFKRKLEHPQIEEKNEFPHHEILKLFDILFGIPPAHALGVLGSRSDPGKFVDVVQVIPHPDFKQKNSTQLQTKTGAPANRGKTFQFSLRQTGLPIQGQIG